MEREQIIKALECCASGYCDSNGGCPYYKEDEFEDIEKCTSELISDALALIKELTEENERLKADNKFKVICHARGYGREQFAKKLIIKKVSEIKADTINAMYSEIKERCIKGGIYPAFVSSVVTEVANEMLKEE